MGYSRPVPFPVTTGAPLTCSFGIAPGTLVVLPDKRVTAESKPAATILDFKPFVNITPFSLCNSLANPITAAQTSAALGVLTPGTCIPTPVAPWSPGATTTMIGGVPALTDTSICNCAYGGVIQIQFGGPVKTQIT